MMKPQKLVFFLLLMGLGVCANAQQFAALNHDTLYFLDGRKKMAVKLLEGTENDHDYRFVVPDRTGSRLGGEWWSGGVVE